MDLFLLWIIGVAATWRMTMDIASTRQLEGPFGLYDIIRDHIAFRNYPDWIKDGIQCVWCVSFWFGCFFALFYPLAGLYSWWMYPVLAAGLSGPVTLFFSYVELIFPDRTAGDL